MKRYSFVPFRNMRDRAGKMVPTMVDLGGYWEGERDRDAILHAKALRAVYGYDKVSVESQDGTILAVV